MTWQQVRRRRGTERVGCGTRKLTQSHQVSSEALRSNPLFAGERLIVLGGSEEAPNSVHERNDGSRDTPGDKQERDTDPEANERLFDGDVENSERPRQEAEPRRDPGVLLLSHSRPERAHVVSECALTGRHRQYCLAGSCGSSAGGCSSRAHPHGADSWSGI